MKDAVFHTLITYLRTEAKKEEEEINLSGEPALNGEAVLTAESIRQKQLLQRNVVGGPPPFSVEKKPKKTVHKQQCFSKISTFPFQVNLFVIFDGGRMLTDSILDLIGNTPLIQLKGENLFAKFEFLNLGGSIKDRVAMAMIEGAVAP